MIPPVISVPTPVFGCRLRRSHKATRTPVTLPDVEKLAQVIWEVRNETYGVALGPDWREPFIRQLREIALGSDPLRKAYVLKNRAREVVGGFVADKNVTVLQNAQGKILRCVPENYQPEKGERVLKPGEHKAIYIVAGFIKPQYRRQGHAEDFVSEVLTASRQNGIKTVLVNARPMARPVLENFGFETVLGPLREHGETPENATYWMRLTL